MVMGETQPPQLKDSRPLSPFDESLVPRAHSLEPTAVNLLFEPVSPAKVSLLVDLPPPTTSPLRVRVVGRYALLVSLLTAGLTRNTHRVIGIDLVNEVILIADQGVAIVVKLTAARAGVVLSSYNPSLKDLVMITGLWSLPDVSSHEVTLVVYKLN